jgi:hypothetical protein
VPAAQPASAKFRLVSELGQTVNASHIGEKIMDTMVHLPIRDVLAVSPEVAGYLHDQTRKRRVPVAASTASAIPNSSTVSTASPVPNSSTVSTVSTVPTIPTSTISTASTNLTSLAGPEVQKSYYALPSGRAKVTLNHSLMVDSLLDNGSEVNMMPVRVFEKLELPIDTEIGWRINTYEDRTNHVLDEHGPVGVCHGVPVDIGGVVTKQNIFVVKYSNQDLILGRPWERAVRAEYVNEDDGTYTARIKSLDGRRQVQFVAAKAQHERNREYVRSESEILPQTEHLNG